MHHSTGYTRLFLITFSLLLFFFFTPAISAETLPTAQDINSLAESAKLTAADFFEDSFILRIKYHCGGNSLMPEDKDSLCSLAKKARDRLQQTEDYQRKLKSQIENYTGHDWDKIYGQTGLWRKLSADIYTNLLSKCRITFYLAASSENTHTERILNDIITEIDSINLTDLPPAFQLIKANSLALLSQNNPQYKQQAQKQFDSFLSRSDIDPPLALRISIEKIKSGFDDPKKLDAITDTLYQCCPDDIEIVLLLALAQRNLNRLQALEKTVSLWPQTTDLLGQVLLADLFNQFTQGLLIEQNLQRISPLEADLAALAAWKTKTENYAPLLEHLSAQKKLTTPLTLYVTAMAFTEIQPPKTIQLLIAASRLQQNQKSQRLDLPPDQVAAQAARLAYNLFITNSIDPQLALHSFENYSAIASDNIDPQLEYLHTIILNDAGLTEKSTILLEKMATRPKGAYRTRATLDLIKNKIKQKEHLTPDQRKELSQKLYDLIAAPDTSDLRQEAITLYCYLLLDTAQPDSARQVISLLAKTEIPLTSRLNALKSKAFQQLENFSRAAESLISALEADCPNYAPQAIELLYQIISRIDILYDQTENLTNTASVFEKLAQLSFDCLEDPEKSKAGLYLVEITAFSPEKNDTNLSAAEKLLDQLTKNLDTEGPQILRCRVRLLTKKQNFSQAAEIWAKLADLHKAQPANHKTWMWWRAKYYQLYCYSKSTDAKKEHLLHNIDVLQSTYPDIPPFWAEKLNSLRLNNRPPLPK